MHMSSRLAEVTMEDIPELTDLQLHTRGHLFRDYSMIFHDQYDKTCQRGQNELEFV